MQEVAERAGVAISSVSRVLSEHPDVSEGMRRRVLAAVEELSYTPDLLAQSLRRGETLSVGFVVGDISNPLVAEIALGAEMRLREANYSMLLANSLSSPELDIQHIRLFQQRRADGLLLRVSDETNRSILALLRSLTLPFVLIDHEPGRRLNASAVLSDHRTAVLEAVDHLFALGHRRIGLITGPVTRRPWRTRREALIEGCSARRNAHAMVLSGPSTSAFGADATRQLLDDPLPPTAVIAGATPILQGVLEEVRRRKLVLPEDVSIITGEDAPLASLLDPPLARMSRRAADLGSCAAQLLLERMNGERPRTVTLPVTFVAGPSCSRPRR